MGDLGSIPGLGRSPGEGKGYPLQYFGLEKSVDRVVHGVAKGQTWLSDFHCHFPPTTATNFPDINTIYYVSPRRNIVSTLFTGVTRLIVNPSPLNSSTDPTLPPEVSVTAMLAGKTHKLGFHLVSFRQRP